MYITQIVLCVCDIGMKLFNQHVYCSLFFMIHMVVFAAKGISTLKIRNLHIFGYRFYVVRFLRTLVCSRTSVISIGIGTRDTAEHDVDAICLLACFCAWILLRRLEMKCFLSHRVWNAFLCGSPGICLHHVIRIASTESNYILIPLHLDRPRIEHMIDAPPLICTYITLFHLITLFLVAWLKVKC